MMSENPIYSVQNLTFSYDKHRVLDAVSLDIPEGGVVGLIGPNGSGKSTLLKLLAFLHRPETGVIFFEGCLSAQNERKLRRKATLLLQEPYLLRRSVYENIAYGLRLRGVSNEEIDESVKDSLKRVGMSPDEYKQRSWYRLSGGEAQRVSLAVRLALKPKVLLLDEPTANVDDASVIRIKEAVWRAWSEWGTTIVVATHDLTWLYDVATKIVSMYDGRIVGNGATNLVQGDWQVDKLNKKGEKFASLAVQNQRIVARLPLGGTAARCATLDSSEIRISLGSSYPSDNGNVLNGMIVQMSMERSTGYIIGIVDCGSISLRVRLEQKIARELNLYPGTAVSLSFPVSALNFI